MSTHKNINIICYVAIICCLILTIFLMNASKIGITKSNKAMGYEDKLFDTSAVHSIDITMDNWDEFIADCKSEEYYDCAVTIDDEIYKNVAIRGKGNTSLSQVNNDRYSFKIEFDHYDDANTYHGLDKLCLNNIIQDNTYMKDYLTYQMMADMGVASPLCSYVYITVNGEDWGLYLAVEAVEESFLQRNYGKDYGELYKPDSMNMGGGRGNGREFDMDEFFEKMENGEIEGAPMPDFEKMEPPTGMDFENMEPPQAMDDKRMPAFDEMPEDMPSELPKDALGEEPKGKGGAGMMKGSDDVLLKYIDDEIESYNNIFNNAKTEMTESDKRRLIESLHNLSNGEELKNTVDIEKVIRYFVVHNFVLNFDSYTGGMIHNYYLYEKDGQMQMLPWDYNLAFGGFESQGDATGLVNYPIDSPVSGGNTQERPMIAWIFENEEYTELYHAYFEEFITEYFETGYFEDMMDELSAMIAPYVEKDPTKFCTYEEFQTGISTLREFCLLRAGSIRGQLDGSIGTTTDTQESETFIDASKLKISDMGSMGNMDRGMSPDRPDRNKSGAFR